VNLLHTKIVLASNSPQRAAILKDHGFEYKICPANILEKINPAENPKKNAERIAREKAAVVFQKDKKSLVLAADTIGVSATGEILIKAKSEKDAEKMIRNRAGKTEKVITGWAIFSPLGKVSGAEISEVFFKNIDDDFVKSFLKSGEWRGVAGALRVEGKISQKMIAGFSGHFSNILGLPIEKIIDVLRDFPKKN